MVKDTLASIDHTKFTYLFLFISVLLIIIYSVFGFNLKYTIGNDLVGYIEEAKNSLMGIGFSRTPWGLVPIDDAPRPGRLFPIGYPFFLSVALYLGLSAELFVKIVNIASWFLLIPATIWSTKRLFSRDVSVLIALYVVSSPALVFTVFNTGPDIPSLLLVVLATGLIFNSIYSRRVSTMLVAGLIVSIYYSFRNAATAIILSIVVSHVLAYLFKVFSLKEVMVRLFLFFVGVAPLVIVLVVRNLTMFEELQPYNVKVLEDVSLIASYRVVLNSILIDITGLEKVAHLVAWDYKLILILIIIFAYPCYRALKVIMERKDDVQIFTILYILSFIGASVSMLMIAHSYWGLDRGYLLRHVLPFGWLLCVFIALILKEWDDLKRYRAEYVLPILLVTLSFGHILFASDDFLREKKALSNIKQINIDDKLKTVSSDINYRHQIKKMFAKDQTLINIVKNIEGDAFIASNQGSFLRYITDRPVRNFGFGNITNLFPVLDGKVDYESKILEKRPIYYIILVSNELLRKEVRWKEYVKLNLPQRYSIYSELKNAIIFRNKVN